MKRLFLLFCCFAMGAVLSPVSALELVWERLPGRAKDIGVGADGSVWIVGSANRNGAVYQWVRTNWVATGGSGVFIAVGPAGDPWLVNIDSDLFHRVNDQWVLITEHGSATEVGVGSDGTVLIAGGNSCYCGPVTNQKLYRYDPALGFVLLSGQGVIIQPDAAGRWVINSQGEIFRAQGGGDLIPIEGHARDLGVGANGDIWIIGGAAFEAGNDVIYRWNGAQFEPATTGKGRRISVGPDGTPWMLNDSDEIFRGHRLQLQAQDTSVTNGAVLQFPVTLSYPPDRPVSAAYQVRDPSAGVVATGVVAFTPGLTNQSVNLPTSTNATAGPSGVYRLILSSPVGADLGRAEALGTVVGGPSSGLSLVATLNPSGNLVVRFPSSVGSFYRLQRRSDVSGGSWSSVVGLAGTGAPLALGDSSPPPAQAFYRVIVTPEATP